MLNRFKDATSVRASLLAHLPGGFALAGSYSEGIAQPTFFDLYGFFPNNFVGNPSLKPESSRGFEASLRYSRASVSTSLTAYDQRLHDEIVTIFPPPSFLGTTINLDSTSRRQGVEAEIAWHIADRLRLTATYAYLDATEPDRVSGAQVRELRRPKNSGSLAVDGSAGRFTYGASLGYVGRHFDSRDVFPFDRVTLGSYWLADARLSYAIRPGIELFGRLTNALDQTYQDVFSYRTEPRAAYVGVRFAG
jgi:vitamin B12 transporter